ncbi:hypothetical protein C9374_003204 [Naegleria lovaniensis]|uniref:F-box domain-containing protein n=1 Tax=Naegleria lovaniensis TaxID=51637 RepID=A0AA88GSI6_NAELO|nr:uncharacterized protein C9374_003204 [Naegleria lovaniensis]KAG2386055.1 hypothetical protein C9374_003204 [Naegleria lovaniensis]
MHERFLCATSDESFSEFNEIQQHTELCDIRDSENIFQKVPDEIIGMIIGYLNSVELIFSVSKICKHWRDEIVFPVVKEQYKTVVAGIYGHQIEFEVTSMMDFYTKKQGQRFVKHMLRKRVLEHAIQLQQVIHYSNHDNKDDRVVECNPSWLDTELSILKQYFSNFSDVKEEGILFNSIKKRSVSSYDTSTSTNNGGIFRGAWDYISSLFGVNNSTSMVQSRATYEDPNEISKPQSKTNDFLFKSLLDGTLRAGKTSFLQASLYDTPSNLTDPCLSIGIQFGLRTFMLGDSCKIKLQMWDQYGPERYQLSTQGYYYRNSSVIYFLIDLTDQNEWLEQKAGHICERAHPEAEIIVVGTKSDLHDKRQMLRRDLEKFAFGTFNGALYLEITNTKIEEPQTVVLYSVLLRYLLSSHNSSCHFIEEI